MSKPKDKHKGSRKLIYMNPKEYIDLSLPQKPGKSKYDPEQYEHSSLSNLSKRMKHHLDIDAPSFTVSTETGAIVGHSGRHRAFTAYQLGIPKIPVYLYYKKGPYYIEQLRIPVTKVENVELKNEILGLSRR